MSLINTDEMNHSWFLYKPDEHDDPIMNKIQVIINQKLDEVNLKYNDLEKKLDTIIETNEKIYNHLIENRTIKEREKNILLRTKYPFKFIPETLSFRTDIEKMKNI